MIKNNSVLITLTAQFLSEGILVFLLFSPVFYYYYDWIPYWSYLFVLLFIAFFFMVLSRFTKQFFWYIVAAPFLCVLYILAGLPMVPSAAFAVVLTWRYSKLRDDVYLEISIKYFQWTAVLVAVLTFSYNNWEVVGFLLLQLFIIIFGHMASNAAIVSRDKRSALIKKLGLILSGMILVGSTALVLLKVYGVNVFLLFWSSVIVPIWDLVVTVIAFVASLPIYLFELLNIEPSEIQDSEDEQEMNTGSNADTLRHTIDDNSSTDAFISFVYILLGAILLAILLIYVYRTIRRRFMTDESDTQSSALVTYTAENAGKDKQNVFTKLNRFFNRQPSHPVRKMIFQFERKAEKTGNGREPSETLQEWFKRVSLDVDVSAYEKVRYGEVDVSETEIKQLREALNAWEF
ncbi:hypothetical protein JNUCC1_02136 [Lentibacillus sp. JNUCC-1]|uniref:DUF4129 domain-containing protein n=1 Tax=Lentibacillus sp. JNUCC-1 TaxID=2654513 RepID=UPI001328536D|nr:DUF4129 domain-containing protein [Lentibacillus sp. JNUCC-1]MUV38298.1 hypothetical protein [Lentibacillus sp. JNUCC-1]